MAGGAQNTITRYQEQESEGARAIQDAERAYDEIIQSAKAHAEEMAATGFAVDVAGSADTQLVLRLGSPATRPVPR